VDNRFELTVSNIQKMQLFKELQSCNEITLRYGLTLSEQQIQNLVERRIQALKDTGRIEFGQGVLKKIITEFCDSPYITQDNYEETIIELQDAFYYFKNESIDLVSDDELISNMKSYFDGVCQGSLDYLSGTTLDELCRGVRFGYEPGEPGEMYGPAEYGDMLESDEYDDMLEPVGHDEMYEPDEPGELDL